MADLRVVAGLTQIAAAGTCPAIGSTVDVQGFSPHIWGDINCADQITALDAIAILRYSGGLSPLAKNGQCPDVGQNVTLPG